MRQTKTRNSKLHLSVIIFFICLLFTVVAWDHYFNSESPLDQTLVSNLILFMGTLFSVSAGILVWTLESGKSFLETEVVRRTEEVIEKEKLAAAAKARMTEAEAKQKEIAAAYQRLKELQGQLIQQEKLASVGRVVAGIVHELKNPLITLEGYVEMLSESAQDEQLIKNLQVIDRQTRRCEKVVQDLLMYSRQEKLTFKSVDVIDVVQKMLSDLQLQWTRDEIKVDFKHDVSVLSIEADENQLERVLMNILMNAGHALQEVRHTRELHVKVIQATDSAQILIMDNGPGISKEHLDQIFEPFFTTKPVGKGTGLGLSLCQGIIAMHGGRISAQSEEGRGTVFLIELPVCQKAGPRELPKTRRKIMVIDDDKNVCAFVSKLLESWGYEVMEVSDAEKACALIVHGHVIPDLLILDVSMPSMSGYELAKKVRTERSRLPIVFLTAKNINFDEQEARQAGGVACLFKPFDYQQLKDCVEQIFHTL